MCSPQLSNGYTAIANEILEALIAYRFKQNEYKVLFAIIRKTYGYQKKIAELGNTQIAMMTGIDRSHVARCIRSLIKDNVLIHDESKYKSSLGLNKNYRSWAKRDTVNTKPKTSLQSVTNLDTDKNTKCGQIAPLTVAILATVNGEKYDQSSHTLKKVKTSINKTPLLLSDNTNTCQNKNELGSGSFDSGLKIAEQGSSTYQALIYPNSLSDLEKKAASQLLLNCKEASQGLLDVLSATIKAGKIQTSALALLGALVRRQVAGTFDPSPGFKIKLDRERVPKPVVKVVKTSSVDKDTQRQNMANLLAGTNIRLSNREA